LQLILIVRQITCGSGVGFLDGHASRNWHPAIAAFGCCNLRIVVSGNPTFGQAGTEPTVPKLNYEAVPNFFQLAAGENFVEPCGVAVNSKGHIYVFHRGRHPLMEFDSSGKFVRSLADDLFVTAHSYEWTARTIFGQPMSAHMWS
jgi:hypothetical protein